MLTLKKEKKFWIGILITTVCLYITLREIDWEQFFHLFKTIDYIYLFPIFLVIIVSYWLRAYRWRFLLLPIKQIEMKNLFSITMVGFMLNNILPLRMGEFYRAYAVGKDESLSISASFATIILERIFDILTLLLFFFFVSRTFVLPEWANKTSNLILFLTCLLFTLLIVMFRFTQVSIKILGHFVNYLPVKFAQKLKSLFNSFIEGLGVLKNKGHLLIITILSILIWMLMALFNQLVFYSFSSELPLMAAFTLLVITALGVMIPSAPGYIGTFQLFTIIALGLYSVNKVEALSISIFLHISEYLLVTTMGLIYFSKKNISFKKLTDIQKVD